MLLEPTDDPGSDIILGSILTDAGRSLLTDGGRSLFTDEFAPRAFVGRSLLTDTGSLFIEDDEMLPPY